MDKELDEAFQKFMMPALERILKVIERIEKKVNECGLCRGAGYRVYQTEKHGCPQCKGLGVMRNE
jgi:hypothetical protein